MNEILPHARAPYKFLELLQMNIRFFILQGEKKMKNNVINWYL